MSVTDEQIEAAAKAMFVSKWVRGDTTWDKVAEWVKEDWRQVARIACPHLQIPWEEPSGDELYELRKWILANVVGAHSASSQGIAIRKFVEHRNAALQPKPVDPRREKIRASMAGRAVFTDDELDRILAALDAKD